MKNVLAQRRDEQKAKEKEAEDIASLYKMVFGSPAGAKVLKHLNKFCQLNDDVFSIESERATTYCLGRKSVAIHIKKLLEMETNKKEN